MAVIHFREADSVAFCGTLNWYSLVDNWEYVNCKKCLRKLNKEKTP